jgi:hypothetical protein
VTRRSGDVSEIGRHGEGDEVDRRGPHGSDVRVKASLPECAKSKEIQLLANMPRLLGPNGLSVHPMACGQSGPAQAGLGQMGRNLRRVLFQIKIGFLNIPRLWKFGQGDLGGILT